jgi:hypothetical protein
MKRKKISEIVDRMERNMLDECVAREMKDQCKVREQIEKVYKKFKCFKCCIEDSCLETCRDVNDPVSEILSLISTSYLPLSEVKEKYVLKEEIAKAVEMCLETEDEILKSKIGGK